MGLWKTWFGTVLKTASGSGVEGDPSVLEFKESNSDPKSGTPTLSSIASSTSNQTLLAANPTRLGVIIYNESTQPLYLKFGATATVSNYTAQIPANTEWRLPFRYTGQLDGIWASANGNARITELT